MSEAMMWLMGRGIWETVIMTLTSGFFGFVLGLPFGVLLYVTRPGQIAENKNVYRVMSALVNIFRSIPFIILLVWMIPFTRVIVGTSIGLQAAIVPLTVGAGGLGQIGYQYGYIGYDATVMNTVLVLLVVLVYLIQFCGDRIVKAVTHK